MIALPEILSGMAPGLLGMAVAIGGAIWFKVEQRKASTRLQAKPAAPIASQVSSRTFATRAEAEYFANTPVVDPTGYGQTMVDIGKVDPRFRMMTPVEEAYFTIQPTRVDPR